MAWIDLIGRLLLGTLFAAGAWQKAVDPGAAQGLLAGFGLPGWLVWPACAFNAALALGLVFGPQVRLWAIAGTAYCVVTSVFHFIPGDGWQMSIFVKNWAIAGGFLVLAASSQVGVRSGGLVRDRSARHTEFGVPIQGIPLKQAAIRRITWRSLQVAKARSPTRPSRGKSP